MLNKLLSRKIIFLLMLFNFLFSFSSCGSAQYQKIRKPAVAGMFYPKEPSVLKKTVDQLIAKSEIIKIQSPILGLIAPHAGYTYSGHVAASIYSQLKGKKIKRVVIISPSHLSSFKGASIYNGDVYATPLGNITVDKEFADKLAAQSKLLYPSSKGHEDSYQGRGEHALEVQLPFLQRTLKEFKFIPIIMGNQSYETSRALGHALAQLIQNSETIIVASSDLSHFHPYDEAVKLDRKVLTAIEEWDHYNLSRNLNSRLWEACGGGPIVATMIATEILGANTAKLIKYANSGDIPRGNRSSVVGYSSFAFIKDESKANQENSFNLNESEQKELLRIAKIAVEKIVNSGKKYEFSEENLGSLIQDRGAFVTLNKNGQLRGCIGYTAPIQPLCFTVRDVAIQAAINDRRFTPVKESELPYISYEISVLSPFRKVIDINNIHIGEHGLLIQKGTTAGLLLPQVASEYKWDRITFLEQTCRKAGLPANAWKDEETDIFKFSAFVFSEH